MVKENLSNFFELSENFKLIKLDGEKIKVFQLKVSDEKREYFEKTVKNFESIEQNLGYVESIKNIRENAIITYDAVACENSIVYGNSLVSYKAIIRGNAQVFGSSLVDGKNTIIKDNARIYGGAMIRLGSIAKDNVWVHGFYKALNNDILEKNNDYYIDPYTDEYVENFYKNHGCFPSNVEPQYHNLIIFEEVKKT